MTADRARGALAVLQDADGKFICEVPCGYIAVSYTHLTLPTIA